MSITALNQMGVPHLSGERGAVLQPILTDRFRVSFYNFGDEINAPAPYTLTRHVKRVSLPPLNMEQATLWHYGSAIYIHTRSEHGEASVTFLDTIDNSVFRRVEQQSARQRNMHDATFSRAGQNYKFELDIDALAGGASAGQSAADPNVLRKYCFSGAQIIGIEEGELNYDTANPKEITMRIRFDALTKFDHLGIRLGTFSHSPEIDGQRGLSSTGSGGSGFNVNGATLNVNGSVSVGGATVSGSLTF